MTARKKHAGGRPTKYKPEFDDQAEKLCRLGASDVELAEFFNVCINTITNWRAEHPGFLGAIKRGKDWFDTARVEGALIHRALGYEHPETKFATFEGKITDTLKVIKHYPPDTAALIFWLKNRNPERWRDKQEIDHTTQGDKITRPVIMFSEGSGK